MAKPRHARELPDGRVSFIGHDASGEELVKGAVPPPAHQRAARVVPRRRHPAPPRARLPRPRAPARSARDLPLPAHMRAGGDRGDGAVVRRPARHARAQRRGRDRRAPRPRLRDHGRRRSSGGATGAPKPPLRGDELARELGIERGPRARPPARGRARGGIRGRGARPRSGGAAMRAHLCENQEPMTIVDCAVYEQGERDGRLARPRARGIPARRRVRVDRPARADAGGVRPPSAGSSASTSSRSRTRSRRTSGRSSSATATSRSSSLKTARYVEPDEIEFGEILLFIGDDFVVSVRHGEAVPLHGVRVKLEHRPELLKCGPMAVVLRDPRRGRRRVRAR